jgi:hypothetical protein
LILFLDRTGVLHRCGPTECVSIGGLLLQSCPDFSYQYILFSSSSTYFWTRTFSNGHTIESGGLKAYRRRNIDELNIHRWARGNILLCFIQIVIGFISYIMWIAILPHFILCSLCIILRSGYRLHISCPNGGKYRAMLYVWCERIIESTSEDEEELKHPPQPSLLASKFWDHVLQSCVTATPEQTLQIFSLLHRCFVKRQVILQRPRIMDAFAGSSSLTKDSRRISTGECGIVLTARGVWIKLDHRRRVGPTGCDWELIQFTICSFPTATDYG